MVDKSNKCMYNKYFNIGVSKIIIKILFGFTVHEANKKN